MYLKNQFSKEMVERHWIKQIGCESSGWLLGLG